MVQLSYVIGIVSAALCFLVIGILVLASRRPLSPTRQVVIALAIHLTSVVFGALGVGPVAYWHVAAVYWALFFAYLHVFGGLYKSISLTMLRYLASVPNEKVAETAIVEDVIHPCFDGRFQLLVDGGHVNITEDKYYVSNKGMKVATKIKKFQSIFGIDRCGLYDH